MSKMTVKHDEERRMYVSHHEVRTSPKGDVKSKSLLSIHHYVSHKNSMVLTTL